MQGQQQVGTGLARSTQSQRKRLQQLIANTLKRLAKRRMLHIKSKVGVLN